MKTSLVAIALLSLTTSGCVVVPDDPPSAATTAAIPGAVIGGIIGAQSDETLAGAALGAFLFGYQAFAYRSAERQAEISRLRYEERLRLIDAGYAISDDELWEARERARQAEAHLRYLRHRRAAAEYRACALIDARRREAEANAAIEELLAP